MATSHQDGLDPADARTPEAFMELLRQARDASGLTIVEIAQRARQRGYDLDPIDLAQALELPTLPGWQTVTGVLTACGMGGMQIDRWMRVYHDLAAPAQPTAPAAPATAVQEPIDAAPVSVPPLVLTTPPAKPARLGPRHLAIGAAVLAALVVVPLLLFAQLGGEPDPVAADATSSPPRTIDAPAPTPSDLPVALPLPTEAGTPSTPAPVTTTKPPTTPPPAPPPPPTDILRSGVAELIGNQGFDLDSGQTEGARDISRWGKDGLTGTLLGPVSGVPGKPACQAGRDWRSRVGDLQAGQWLCVRTSDGRYGRLNITALGDTLTFSYTVWI